MPDDGPLVFKVGTIVREDPVLQFGKNGGKPYTRFSLKVQDWVPNGPKPDPTFYEVTCFGGTAERVAECMKQGYRVGVHGVGKLRDYTKKDGTPGQAKEIAARFVGPDLQFVTVELHGNEKPAAQPAVAPVDAYADEPVF